jgi:hypothetical protein
METLAVSGADIERTIIFISTVFRLELATCSWSTGIYRTEIAIFTNNRHISALAIHAAIIGTDTAIITIVDCDTRWSRVTRASGYSSVEAARDRITLVQRTVHVVIAINRLVHTACFCLAGIECTNTIVIAIDQLIGAGTACEWITVVSSTRVIVAAVLRCIDTARCRVAGIHRTIIVEPRVTFDLISTI